MGKPKSIRTTVCFPPSLHTQVKVAIAQKNPSPSLTDFVAGIVANSGSIPEGWIRAAFTDLDYEAAGREPSANTPIRASVTLSAAVARGVKERAKKVGLNQSRFIVGAVAYRMAQNGH